MGLNVVQTLAASRDIAMTHAAIQDAYRNGQSIQIAMTNNQDLSVTAVKTQQLDQYRGTSRFIDRPESIKFHIRRFWDLHHAQFHAWQDKTLDGHIYGEWLLFVMDAPDDFLIKGISFKASWRENRDDMRFVGSDDFVALIEIILMKDYASEQIVDDAKHNRRFIALWKLSNHVRKEKLKDSRWPRRQLASKYEYSGFGPD